MTSRRDALLQGKRWVEAARGIVGDKGKLVLLPLGFNTDRLGFLCRGGIGICEGKGDQSSGCYCGQGAFRYNVKLPGDGLEKILETNAFHSDQQMHVKTIK